MPLFRDNPLRSAATAVVVVSVGHFATRLLSSLNAFHLTQTSVAILAILGLFALVILHHRRDGQLLTQSQEEMVLISSFALFWIVLTVAWRALTSGSLDGATSNALSAGQSGGSSFACASDDLYCIIEERIFY